MNKSKTKYNNTSGRMSAALLKLLDQKPLDKISIRELCDEAGVNRSTFYTHYDSINDILEETRTSIVDAFIADQQRRKAAGLDEDVLTDYLELIKRHRNFYKVHMETTSPLAFTEIFSERIMKRLEAMAEAGGSVDEKRVQYMARYYLLGIFAVIKKWVDEGCKDSVEYIHGIIHECTIGD